MLRETTTFILMGENIRTEGIFRIPPNLRLKEILREAYDRGQKFIVWREGLNTLPLPPYEGAEDVEAVVSELDANDCYGVHLAAGLCKYWYSELRQPLVPVTSYQDLKQLFGDPGKTPTAQELAELLSQTSKWSVLPVLSREILTRHLLPMLSTIAEQHEYNKMTAENLAVCFGATLLCGPDQLEDAKVSSIIRRILRYAVAMWEPHLREACEIASDAFIKDLEAPARLEDYEDPLDEADVPDKRPESPPEYERYEQQRVGIVLRDNESTQDCSPIATGSDFRQHPQQPASTQQPDDAKTVSSIAAALPPRQPDISKALAVSIPVSPTPPALPPRQPDPTQLASSTPASHLPPALPPRNPQLEATKPESSSDETSVKRKPAPPTVVPPRYSTIAASPEDVTESPTTYMAVADGFGPPRPSGVDSQMYESHTAESPISGSSPQVKRKPVTSLTSAEE